MVKANKQIKKKNKICDERDLKGKIKLVPVESKYRK